MTTSFSLSYDYRCPFAKNIHLHVLAALRDGADYDVSFVPWSLSQNSRPPGTPDVWDDPAMADDVAALAASVSVRDHQPERFLTAHEALFRARHESFIRLANFDEVADVLARVGVDVDEVRRDIASGRPQFEMGESFRRFEKLEAFGVPTFVLGEDATFVRYMKAPLGPDAESTKLIDSLLALMARDPDLNEFKHTRLPN